MSNKDYPEVKLITDSGTRLRVGLKKYWMVYFGISVLAAAFHVSFLVADIWKGNNVTQYFTGTPASKYRKLAKEWEPKVRKDRWEDFLYRIKRSAETGATERGYDASDWGKLDSPEMKWFLKEVKKAGFSYEIDQYRTYTGPRNQTWIIVKW
jgi:hypothetical protein